MYHVVSRHPVLRMKNDSRSAGFTSSTLTCQACIVRPSCSSTLSSNQGDLVLTPDIDFCETHPLPLIASIQLTPSLDQVFKHVPPASSQFHVYSVAEARQSVLNSVRMELAEIPDVKRMSPEALDQLTKPIADYYSSISPATSAALCVYLPTRTAVCFLLSITVSSRSVLPSPCSAGSGVVCSPIHNNSSEEHLAVSFTLLTTRPYLMMMTLLFCTSPLPNSRPCKSLLKKLYVDLSSLPILLHILPLTHPLTLSLPLTYLPLTLTVFTPLLLPPFIRKRLLKFVPMTTPLQFSTYVLFICLYVYVWMYVYLCLPNPYSSFSMMLSDAYPRFIEHPFWLIQLPGMFPCH